MSNIEETNKRLLNIAMKATGLEVGALGGIFTTDKELLQTRVISLMVATLTPFYKVESNRENIDLFIKKTEEVFNSGYGYFSLEGAYSSLIDDLADLLESKPINK